MSPTTRPARPASAPAGLPAGARSPQYELFMLGLSIYVLLQLAVEALLPLNAGTREILGYADTGICFIFLADFLRSLIRAESKLGYLKWGWIDLLSSIPMVDAFRVGRAARIFRVLRMLRGFRSLKNLTAFILQRRAQAAFTSAALISIVLLIFSSVAVYEFERGAPGTNISTPQDAMWWAYVTITTVGYGDHFPVTFEGRMVAAVLMLAGVGLFGAFTGFVATWFLAPGEAEEAREMEEIRRELRTIRAELAEREASTE